MLTGRTGAHTSHHHLSTQPPAPSASELNREAALAACAGVLYFSCPGRMQGREGSTAWGHISQPSTGGPVWPSRHVPGTLKSLCPAGGALQPQGHHI